MKTVAAHPDGEVLATLLSCGDEGPASRLGGDAIVMSRFAWIRRDGSTLIAETARSPDAVVLYDPRAVTLLLSLVTPARLDSALASAAGLPLTVALEIAALLGSARILIDASAALAEDEPPLATWEFHDLLFHSRTRLGGHRGRSGGTYRFADRFPGPPATPPARWPEALELPPPDWERIEHTDPPLSSVQSRRMSLRRYGTEPLQIDQLGEFLYRVGRVEDVWEAGGESFVAKPYPSGGSRHGLELYAAIRACRGIDPGLYHYAADRHALEQAAGETAQVDGLIDGGAAAMGAAPATMQVLLVIAARADRVAWKYESIAYALLLKDVGVLFQTMYLAATAMRLAPCALGVGNPELFARAAGLDPQEQPTIGEFALGSRAER